MKPLSLLVASGAVAMLVACGGGPPHPSGHHPQQGGHGHHAPAEARADDPIEAGLRAVASVHGGAGPWAVAGYRMAQHALRALDLEPGSFDLEVVHHTPREVQYACIADGAAAATGASLGKLNLALVDAIAAETHTTYRRKSTGQAITLRPASAFVDHYADVPRERLGSAGREVMGLPEAEVFEVVAR